MAIEVYEKFNSREESWNPDEATDNQKTLGYIIQGSDDDAAVKSALEAAAPAAWGALTTRQFHVEPIGPLLWEGTVRYGRKERQASQPQQTGEATFSFDTTGGTQHITQSLSTSGKYGRRVNGDPIMPPDFKGAIGVTHDNVEGVDITIPIFAFSITRYIASNQMTAQYVGYLYALTGRVNQAEFAVNVQGVMLTFQAGECLFLGASGSQRGTDDWEITFKFAASPNVANLVIGDITVASKKGWEYLWLRYADTADTDAKCVVKRPVAAYVEKVYKDGDFSLLGFGS